MPRSISVENLGKRFTLGANRTAYRTLRETITNKVTGLLSTRNKSASRDDAFWALRDVAFEISAGEVVGVIGRNGAGKSTLLKLLSRITRPTTGNIRIQGRMASLLEVGTGFHPELTGRENIFLNGAILGMSRREIAREFDAIVEFAEVARFIDSPVKRYSSGMYLRLAFSVAAHLEPEILIVDEVLAVGDAAFQRKCLGKMDQAARTGRTILFVSHNLSAVRSLCQRGILLDRGRVVFDGTAEECLRQYTSASRMSETGRADLASTRRSSHSDLSLQFTAIQNSSGPGGVVPYGHRLTLELQFVVARELEEVVLGVAVQSPDHVTIFECRSTQSFAPIPRLSPGSYSIQCTLDSTSLAPGTYRVSIGARCAAKHLDYLPDVLTFDVSEGAGMGCTWFDECAGLMRVSSTWSSPISAHV